MEEIMTHLNPPIITSSTNFNPSLLLKQYFTSEELSNELP